MKIECEQEISRRLEVRWLLERSTVKIKVDAETTENSRSREIKVAARPRIVRILPSSSSFPFRGGFIRSISSPPLEQVFRAEGSLYPSACLYYRSSRRERSRSLFRLLYNRECKWCSYPLAARLASSTSCLLDDVEDPPTSPLNHRRHRVVENNKTQICLESVSVICFAAIEKSLKDRSINLRLTNGINSPRSFNPPLRGLSSTSLD